MTSVVVLTRDYQYWTDVDLRKIFSWLIKDKIEIIVSHESEEVGSITFKIKRPLVVRLLKFIGYKAKHETISYSKEAVFSRDLNYCQYYHYDDQGRSFKYRCSDEERSIDHIIPTSRGGDPRSFENYVCSCKRCNVSIKGSRTPAEAGLRLIRQPTIPKRKAGEFVTITFPYNPSKLAHRVYAEKVLGMIPA